MANESLLGHARQPKESYIGFQSVHSGTIYMVQGLMLPSTGKVTLLCSTLVEPA